MLLHVVVAGGEDGSEGAAGCGVSRGEVYGMALVLSRLSAVVHGALSCWHGYLWLLLPC